MPYRPSPFPLQSHLGMVIESAEPGRARATVHITEELHNPNGVVHGAVLFAMADTSMGAATMSILGDDQACATVEVHMRFLRPAATGTLTAEAAVVKAGRRVMHLESSVRGEDGALVATATGTFVVIPAAGAAR